MTTVRDQLRRDVAARRPVDARERDAIAEFLAELDVLQQPFSEEADRRHVTASAIVVSDDGRQVALHRHKRLQMWLQPGGHIDDGESPWEAARREAVEETGLPVTMPDTALVHVDVHPGPRGHRHLDVRYVLQSPPVTPRPADGESQDVRWFPWRSAIATVDPGLEGILRAMQPGEPKLRRVRGNDASECAHVFLRSRAFGVADVPVVHPPNEVRRWMADEVVGHTDMWVADLDGTVVGLLVLDHGWVEHLYLDPAWMGRGLGDRFVEIAKAQSPGGLQLWTFQVNGPARRFYARHGFVEAETTDGHGNEERAPDVRLTWTP